MDMQDRNPLAVELLGKLGNVAPSQKQIQLLETVMSTVAIEQCLMFDKRLTTREMTCLFLATRGLTSDQSAAILGIKKSTVETHRKEIKRKLGCINMAQAIFEGIRFGYITPRYVLGTDLQGYREVET